MGNIIMKNNKGDLRELSDDIKSQNLLQQYIYNWAINKSSMTDDSNNILLNKDVLRKRACCTLETNVSIDLPVFTGTPDASGNLTFPNATNINNIVPATNNIINSASISIKVFNDAPPNKTECSNLVVDAVNSGIFYFDKTNNEASNHCKNFYSESAHNFCNSVLSLRKLNIIDQEAYQILFNEIGTPELRFNCYACFVYLRLPYRTGLFKWPAPYGDAPYTFNRSC